MSRPPEDDMAAIRRMVELLAAEPSLSIRVAAREAARQLKLPGQLSTHEERLRKKYVELRNAGQLPTPDDAAVRFIREAYAAHATGMQRLRDELAALEQEATALGLDVSPPDLGPLFSELGREVDRLDLVAGGNLEVTVGILMERGLQVEDAIVEYTASKSRSEQAKRRLRLVQEIRQRRRAFGLDRGSPPVSPQS